MRREEHFPSDSCLNHSIFVKIMAGSSACLGWVEPQKSEKDLLDLYMIHSQDLCPSTSAFCVALHLIDLFSTGMQNPKKSFGVKYIAFAYSPDKMQQQLSWITQIFIGFFMVLYY